jgi:hypothetical protein
VLTLLVIPTIYDLMCGARDVIWGYLFPARPAHDLADHPTVVPAK